MNNELMLSLVGAVINKTLKQNEGLLAEAKKLQISLPEFFDQFRLLLLKYAQKFEISTKPIEDSTILSIIQESNFAEFVVINDSSIVISLANFETGKFKDALVTSLLSYSKLLIKEMYEMKDKDINIEECLKVPTSMTIPARKLTEVKQVEPELVQEHKIPFMPKEIPIEDTLQEPEISVVPEIVIEEAPEQLPQEQVQEVEKEVEAVEPVVADTEDIEMEDAQEEVAEEEEEELEEEEVVEDEVEEEEQEEEEEEQEEEEEEDEEEKTAHTVVSEDSPEVFSIVPEASIEDTKDENEPEVKSDEEDVLEPIETPTKDPELPEIEEPQEPKIKEPQIEEPIEELIENLTEEPIENLTEEHIDPIEDPTEGPIEPIEEPVEPIEEPIEPIEEPIKTAETKEEENALDADLDADLDEETEHVDTTPNDTSLNKRAPKRSISPGSPTQHKRFQNIAINLIKSIQAHRYSLPFLQAVQKRDATDYYDVIYEPKDLKSIMKGIKRKTDRQYVLVKDLERDILLMFANCIMYNKLDEDLVQLTRSMRDDVMNSFKIFEDAELQM